MSLPNNTQISRGCLVGCVPPHNTPISWGVLLVDPGAGFAYTEGAFLCSELWQAVRVVLVRITLAGRVWKGAHKKRQECCCAFSK